MIFSVSQKNHASYGIGATNRIGREMLCIPYAGFFHRCSKKIIEHFAEKSFTVCLIGHLQQTKSFFLAFFFAALLKTVFCINSRYSLRQYTDVVKKILCKYFKICISKSCMRPRFFYHPLFFRADFVQYIIHENKET